MSNCKLTLSRTSSTSTSSNHSNLTEIIKRDPGIGKMCGGREEELNLGELTFPTILLPVKMLSNQPLLNITQRRKELVS
jgi:hypothetical protein